MKRIHQILSTGFLALVLFLNIGLSLGLNNGLHAHILSNNQILIHFHHTGGDQPHKNSDTSGCSGFIFSTTLTYLNNAQGITINSHCLFLHKKVIIPSYNGYFKQLLYTSPLRAPPIV